LEIRLVYFFSSSFLRFAVILPALIRARSRAVLPIWVGSTCASVKRMGRAVVGFAWFCLRSQEGAGCGRFCSLW